MPNYRRWRILGGAYFFTVITAQRHPILTTDLGRQALREAFNGVISKRPFDVFAIVLLPDHFHSIWNLPSGDDDFPTRWHDLKAVFTRKFLKGGGEEAPISESRGRKGERGVWQRRYWEHCVQNDCDLKCCLDYIHYNPVKHQLVQQAKDWRWSSFHRFVELGENDKDWGSEVVIRDDAHLFGDVEFA